MVRHPAVGNCSKHPGTGNNQLSQCLGSRARVLWPGTALVPFEWLQYRWALPVLEQMAGETSECPSLEGTTGVCGRRD